MTEFLDKLSWAFMMTIELWVFLGLMGLYLIVEPFLVDRDSE